MNNIYFFNKYKKQMNKNQLDQLYKYYKLINYYNKVMNLSGIDDYEGVYLKHFYDSLTIVDKIDEIKPKTIADIGTGAGFPGIVLAIYYPTLNFSLIEPLKKRINFLKVVIDELNLKNVTLINKRAEDIDITFDLIVSRAVAKLNILLELSIPLVNTGGYFIALKGPKVLEEIKESKNALKILNCEIISNDKIILPVENSTRYNLVIFKNKNTNKMYPREYSKIKKNPL